MQFVAAPGMANSMTNSQGAAAPLSAAPPRRPWLWGGVIALIVVGLVCGALYLYQAMDPTRDFSRDTSIDALLGANRRAAFAKTLQAKQVGGKTPSWDQYADWGKQLVTTGRVGNPPIGASPSLPIAETYRCIDCHNMVRENPRLRDQDPEAREKWIRDAKAADPLKRDATTLNILPGTTLWGAVNRERFYNGHYARYHALKVSSGQAMKPDSLADAVEVCASYCSAGRFPEAWELDSILAFLWDRELKLKDLDLSTEQEKAILDKLKSKDAAAVEDARAEIRTAYLRTAGATQVKAPLSSRGHTDFYPGVQKFEGDAARGKLLYQSACAGCHGKHANEVDGSRLVRDDAKYHKYVWDGTLRKGMYMPMFTEERLSRRQAADIRVYLKSLP